MNRSLVMRMKNPKSPQKSCLQKGVFLEGENIWFCQVSTLDRLFRFSTPVHLKPDISLHFLSAKQLSTQQIFVDYVDSSLILKTKENT